MVFRELVAVGSNPLPFTLKPHVNIPFHGMLNPISAPITWRTNAQGLREDRIIPPQSNKYRIATYGDSETFGWSVEEKDTFQKQMEVIDPSVEVINFGVPGYNVANTADYMEQTALSFHPDLIIYLAHKNDIDESIQVNNFANDFLGWSHALLRVRLMYQQLVLKPKHKRLRQSPARKIFFARQVDRIVQFCQANQIPLLLVLLNRQLRALLREYSQTLSPTPLNTKDSSNQLPRVQFIVVKPIVKPYPKIDHHLSPKANHALAEKLCEMVSSTTVGRCVPPGWQW